MTVQCLDVTALLNHRMPLHSFSVLIVIYIIRKLLNRELSLSSHISVSVSSATAKSDGWMVRCEFEILFRLPQAQHLKSRGFWPNSQLDCQPVSCHFFQHFLHWIWPTKMTALLMSLPLNGSIQLFHSCKKKKKTKQNPTKL